MAEAQPSKKIIKTQRLTLREARHGDVAAFHEFYKDPELMGQWYIIQVLQIRTLLTVLLSADRAEPHDSIQYTGSCLATIIASPTNGELAFVIVLNPDPKKTPLSGDAVGSPLNEGTVIGHVGIWDPAVNKLFFMIGRPYWKQGYMREGLAALILHLWEKGVNKVFVDVIPDNQANMRLLPSLGFSIVGQQTVEYAGRKVECLRMELQNPHGGGVEGGLTDLPSHSYA